MIAYPVTTRTTLYFQLEEDTFPNKGGFYCRVYKDPDKNKMFAEFSIDKRKIVGDDRIKCANKLAVMKIKALYNGIS